MGATDKAGPVRLDEELEAARAAWPTISIETRPFLDYLAERLPKAPAEGAPPSRHIADLYLACGCARGDAAAIEQLETRFLSRLPAFLAGIDSSPDFVDEVRQALREHLLVGREGRAPCIADYTGKGALAHWLRVSAQRIALNLRRGRKGHVELADSDRVTSRNPELDYVRKHSQGEFTQALRAALATLTVHERNLLKLHFVDGLSTAEIAPLFHAHRTTIRRQINECQERLVLRIRESLRERLRLSESQVDSLLREGRKSLELSLSTLL